jgi:hypothetical protein
VSEKVNAVAESNEDTKSSSEESDVLDLSTESNSDEVSEEIEQNNKTE